MSAKKFEYNEVKMNKRQAKKWTTSSTKFFKWLNKNGFNTDFDAPVIEHIVQDGKCYVVFKQIKEVQGD